MEGYAQRFWIRFDELGFRKFFKSLQTKRWNIWGLRSLMDLRFFHDSDGFWRLRFSQHTAQFISESKRKPLNWLWQRAYQFPLGSLPLSFLVHDTRFWLYIIFKLDLIGQEFFLDLRARNGCFFIFSQTLERSSVQCTSGVLGIKGSSTSLTLYCFYCFERFLFLESRLRRNHFFRRREGSASPLKEEGILIFSKTVVQHSKYQTRGFVSIQLYTVQWLRSKKRTQSPRPTYDSSPRLLRPQVRLSSI